MKLFVVPAGVRGRGGGPGSFAAQLASGLSSRGVDVHWGLADRVGAGDVVLVINGTRDVYRLWKARQHGARIVQRVGQPADVFSVMRLGLAHRARSTYRGWLVRLIRSRLADHVVYQSEYTRRCWTRMHGPSPVEETVVLNGVDTEQFRPHAVPAPDGQMRIVVIEGSVGAEPFDLPNRLSHELKRIEKTHTIEVFGRVVRKHADDKGIGPGVRYRGWVSRENLPHAIEGATACLLTDIVTSSCPNSLIEAMACGVPGLAFDYGPAPEIVAEGAGELAAPGGDPASQPGRLDVGALARAAVLISEDRSRYAARARMRAETVFALDRMVEDYARVLWVS